MPSSNAIIYFDNAATSWPKPPAVLQAMQFYMESVGASPGRSGHRLAINAARMVYDARESIAGLLGADDALRVIFTRNVTEGLNLVLQGLLRAGDHVVTGSMEHNSVMRPLRALEREGVELTVVGNSPAGEIEPADVERAIRPHTRLIVLNHASNVVGTLAPVREIDAVARRHGILCVLDAAQSAGVYPIHMEEDQVDILCFTGHKGLMGPQGTGGVIFGERVQIDQVTPLTRGGTGSRSEEEEQPPFLPDVFESGTQNAVGLAGLGAAVEFIRDVGVETVRAHEVTLTRRLLEGLTAIDGVLVYGAGDASRQTSTVSFNVQGLEPSEVGLRLDEEYGIMCRVGLHCAPAAHRTMGTFPGGTVRFGLGYYNTLAEVDVAISAVAKLAAEVGGSWSTS
jgi:cysteine desulfurase / selenocysteine lyase